MSPSRDVGRLRRSFAAVESNYVRDLGHREPINSRLWLLSPLRR